MNPLAAGLHGRPPSAHSSAWSTTTALAPSSSFSAGSSRSCCARAAASTTPGRPTWMCRWTWRSPAAPSTPDGSSGPCANAEFVPDGEYVWRWRAVGASASAIVKFELLADLETAPAGSSVRFDGCESLGAANLRGTGFASRDSTTRQLKARIGGVEHVAEVHVTGLAGFLLAKCAAAYSRRTQKDCDIAFVLLHNDAGGPEAAAQAVLDRFGGQLGPIRTALNELAANFANPEAQGPRAYARQMAIDHPEVEPARALADAVVAVDAFCTHVMAACAGADDPSDADPTGAA